MNSNLETIKIFFYLLLFIAGDAVAMEWETTPNDQCDKALACDYGAEHFGEENSALENLLIEFLTELWTGPTPNHCPPTSKVPPHETFSCVTREDQQSRVPHSRKKGTRRKNNERNRNSSLRQADQNNLPRRSIGLAREEPIRVSTTSHKRKRGSTEESGAVRERADRVGIDRYELPKESEEVELLFLELAIFVSEHKADQKRDTVSRWWKSFVATRKEYSEMGYQEFRSALHGAVEKKWILKKMQSYVLEVLNKSSNLEDNDCAQKIDLDWSTTNTGNQKVQHNLIDGVCHFLSLQFSSGIPSAESNAELRRWYFECNDLGDALQDQETFNFVLSQIKERELLAPSILEYLESCREDSPLKPKFEKKPSTSLRPTEGLHPDFFG